MTTEKLLRQIFGDDPGDFRIESYDGAKVGSDDVETVVRITSPDFSVVITFQCGLAVHSGQSTTQRQFSQVNNLDAKFRLWVDA